MSNKIFLISVNIYFLFITIDCLHLSSNTTKWIGNSCNHNCQSFNGVSCGWLIKSCCQKNKCVSAFGQKCEDSKLLSINCHLRDTVLKNFSNLKISNTQYKKLNGSNWEKTINKIEHIQNLFKSINITKEKKQININDFSQKIYKYANIKQFKQKQSIIIQISDIINNDLKYLASKIGSNNKQQLINLNKNVTQKITKLIKLLEIYSNNGSNLQQNITNNIIQKQKVINDTITKIILNNTLQNNQMKQMVHDLFKIQLENQKLKKIFNQTQSNKIDSKSQSQNHSHYTNVNINKTQKNINKATINFTNLNNNNHSNTIHELNQKVSLQIQKSKQDIFQNKLNNTEIKNNSENVNNQVKISENDGKTTITINKIFTINTIITINKTDKINEVKQINVNDLMNGNVSQNDVNDILAVMNQNKSQNIIKNNK